MQDSKWSFSKPLQFLKKVKYGGAVGKLAVIAVVALIVLAIAIMALWGQTIAVIAIVLIVLIIFLRADFSMHEMLDKHPSLALLEGMEIVEHRKLEMAAKDMPVINAAPAISDPTPTAAVMLGAPQEQEES